MSLEMFKKVAAVVGLGDSQEVEDLGPELIRTTAMAAARAIAQDGGSDRQL